MIIHQPRNARRLITAGALVTIIGLAGCTNPYSPGQRALGGGALGAGAGAIVGAATGGSPATGALIGGGIGALGGALTTPQRPNYQQGGYQQGGYQQGRYQQQPPPPPPGY